MAILMIMKMNSKLPDRQLMPVSRNDVIEVAKFSQ